MGRGWFLIVINEFAAIVFEQFSLKYKYVQLGYV